MTDASQCTVLEDIATVLVSFHSQPKRPSRPRALSVESLASLETLSDIAAREANTLSAASYDSTDVDADHPEAIPTANEVLGASRSLHTLKAHPDAELPVVVFIPRNSGRGVDDAASTPRRSGRTPKPHPKTRVALASREEPVLRVTIPQSPRAAVPAPLTATTSTPPRVNSRRTSKPRRPAAAAATDAGAGAGVGVGTTVPRHHVTAGGNRVLIGAYTREERDRVIAKFLAKRKRRVWKKKIRYTCRKNLADTRVRVKGRFVKASSLPAAAAAPSATPTST